MVEGLFLLMVKSKDDMVNLPFSLLHPLSKNPQVRGLAVGKRRVSCGGRIVFVDG